MEGSAVLKRFLLIFSDLIFDSRVDFGIPSLTAAPEGPATCAPLSRKATSISVSLGHKLFGEAASVFWLAWRGLPRKPAFIHREGLCFTQDQRSLDDVL